MQISNDEDKFKASISLQHTAFKATEQSLTIDIRRSDNGIDVSGVSILELPIMATIATSLAESLGSTLAGIEFADGTASLEVEARLPFDESQAVSATVADRQFNRWDKDVCCQKCHDTCPEGQ